jgi:DNA polymerase-3 subunit delta'
VLSPDHERRPAFARYAGQRSQYDTKRKTPSVIINVEQVRELHDRLHASAHYGGYKLAVLLPADALNTAAANALLKLLEEPPDKTLFLLLSQRAARLPATVRSRCQLLRLCTPPLALAREALPSGGADVDLALDLAGGAPLRARNLLSSDIAQVWRDVEAGCAGLLTGAADPLRLARDWLKLPQEALDAALYGWLRHALRRAGGDASARVRQAAPPARLQAFAAELEDFMRLREHPLVKDLALQRLLYPLWTGG